MPSIFKQGRGQVLVHEGYFYSCNKKSNIYYWTCRSTGCNAKLTTERFDIDDRDAPITVLRSDHHNHPVHREKLDKAASKNEMIDIIMNNPAKPKKRVYDEVIFKQLFYLSTLPSVLPVGGVIRWCRYFSKKL